MRNYENACKNGTVSSADFTRIMGKASTQAQEYSKNIKEGTGSAQIYADKQKTLQQSIQNTGTASRVAAVGVKALSIAGNMLAGMAIAFAISKVIEGIEYLATASERAIEKTKELQQEISQISSDYQSERQTLEGLREEYDALTSKIGENGAEASLSADEYERYRDITSEILGITPKLITGWDEEGRAISNKNGLLQQSIDLLDEEYQKSLRNSTTKSKNEEIAAGIIKQKKDFDNSGDTKTVSGTRYDLVWKDLENYINEAVANKKINYTYESTGIVGTDDADAAYAINEFVYGDSLYKATEMNTAYGWLGSLQERITSSQENFEKFANSLSNEDNPIYQWFTDEQIDELIRGADEYFQELARIEGEEQQYFQQYKDQLNLNAQAVGDAYSGLDEKTKAGITQMINSFDYNDMTKEKFSDMAIDLKDFVGKLSTDDTLRSYFNNLFKPIGEDESIEDYETRVKTGIDEITSYCESNYPAIKLSFGDVESNVEALKLKYNTAISKFTGDANDVDLGKFFEDNSINDESEIDYWNKVTEGAKSATEAVEMYNKAKSEANKLEPLSFTEQISQVQILSKGLDQLGKIYKDVQDGIDFDYDSILNNTDFKDTFGSYTEEYNNFIKTITNSPNDINACQEAFNKLASAYIYGSEKLQGVTRETQAATVAFLEQKGVTNALAIVERQVTINEEILAIAKDDLAIASGNLADATVDELKDIVEEGKVSEVTANYLDYLLLSKIDLNDYKLKTQDDVNQIIAIAEAAGVASEQVVALEKVLTTLSGFRENFTPVDLSKLSDEQLNYAPQDWVNEQKEYANAVKEAQAIIDEAAQSKFDPSDFYAKITSPSSSKDSSKDSKTTFDWIETKISRIQRKITNFGKTVSATYLTWSTRNNALLSELSAVNEEIVTQEQAYKKYLALADSVGLSEPYKSLVQSGGLQIDTITDENLKEKIELYKDYYEKYLEAYDAWQDGATTLAEKVREQFDLAASEHDSNIDAVTSRMDIIDSYIDQVETRGHMVSKSYYEELKSMEESNISSLTSKYSKLTSILNNAVNAGTIKKGSEEYNNMMSEINGVQQALVEANTALIEYDNTMRELDWEVFDKIQDKISQIAEETDFLIELMSDEKMFDDGITEFGQATMGLHAVNYETYMQQSKKYGDELLKINKQLANDTNDWTLIERKAELIELQRESILAAQDEKDAIIDLVSQGYDEFLDSLDNAIEKYNELLDAEKSLYDYEKNISEQTANIASLRKQLMAYSGDNSESAKTKIQQITVDLEKAEQELQETEMDKNIQDRQQLLTALKDEAELFVSERLDKEDEILKEVIADTNKHIDGIKDTLDAQTNAVGIALSDELNKIFGEGGSVATIESTISTTLTDIKNLIQSMVGDSDKVASDNINNSNTPSSTPSTPPSTPTTNNTANTNSSSSGNDKWGSWFIPKKNSVPDSRLNINSSIVDRLKWKDFDSSFDARKSYYTAMGGSGQYKGSSSQNRWMIAEMKKHAGFAKGGTIGSLIKSTGEDGFILARTGEEILSLDKIKELGFTFEKMKPLVDTMKYLPNVQSNTSNRTMDVKVDIGDIQMYGVNDPEQFAKQLKGAINNNSSVRKMLNDVTLGEALGRNSLTRYTR